MAVIKPCLTPRDFRVLGLGLAAMLVACVAAWIVGRNGLLAAAIAAAVGAVMITRPRGRALLRRLAGKPPRTSYYID